MSVLYNMQNLYGNTWVANVSIWVNFDPVCADVRVFLSLMLNEKSNTDAWAHQQW